MDLKMKKNIKNPPLLHKPHYMMKKSNSLLHILITLISFICFMNLFVGFKHHPTVTDKNVLISNVQKSQMKVLHIITSHKYMNFLNEGDIKFQSRLHELLLPVLQESVTSMMNSKNNWKVDVYLILGYDLRVLDKQLIFDSLPDGVGLEIWESAIPVDYAYEDDATKIKRYNMLLARQHRYVLADKLEQYDFFSVWEEDMLVKSHHIEHFLKVSKEIDRLKEEAKQNNVANNPFDLDGPLSHDQLQRLYPGFFRVEVLGRNETAQSVLDPIPVDTDFSSSDSKGKITTSPINPELCCSISSLKKMLNPKSLSKPKSDDVVAWEVGIRGFSVRKFPESSFIKWVALQHGTKNEGPRIGSYWSGTGDKFGKFVFQPSPSDYSFVGQQAGYLATRDHIKFFHSHCEYGFLPPFTKYNHDGHILEDYNTLDREYWFGSLELFGFKSGSCNLQRVLLLEPENFSKQLIYHASNNKHATKDTEKFVKVNNLVGQLNSVKKAAMLTVMDQQSQKNK